MRIGVTLTFVAVVLVLGIASPAEAVCNQTAASQADRDLWNTHGCWHDFYLWHYRAYDTPYSDWKNRGWSDACNSRFEYPKHWNSAYLITYGLQDNWYNSFHGTSDYRAVAEAASSRYHKRIHHKPVDRTDIYGSYSPSSGAVSTSCLLYNPGESNANPAARAGTMIHEGWHAWYHKYNYKQGSAGGHHPGPQGACTINGCDYFYFHGIGRYAFGSLWYTDGTAARFHSPNQVQVEFLCDVADFPKPWVPKSVRETAAADANRRATQRFINGPGYRCGQKRPW